MRTFAYERLHDGSEREELRSGLIAGAIVRTREQVSTHLRAAMM